MKILILEDEALAADKLENTLRELEPEAEVVAKISSVESAIAWFQTNAAPDLVNLKDGDLQYQVDFREVYATVLDKWLDVSNQQILNRNFAGLDFI